MGTNKKSSSDQWRFRLSLPPEDRVTLLPCPACGGDGKSLTDDGKRYTVIACRWCDGSGVVDSKIISMFRRWLKIKHHSRKSGRCKPK